ncbi:MAG: hypothetical protein KF712_03150 [Akkermansiaceae bacterium]|nr:hypothetical protein [Akkermansiaceae bacterium]
MHHPSIRIEGAILTGDILDAIERGDKSGQSPKDFGLPTGSKVKDDIAEAWGAARAFWTAYQGRLDRLRPGASGTTETRNLFMVPFLGLLGYQTELADSESLSGKTYAISHRDSTRGGFPVHIIGPNHTDPSIKPDRSTLDVRIPGQQRMSPHGLVQEYLNLTEHLYALVTNGRTLRLLRDSSRLIKLSFIEFDLERIFTDELFADFALLYRLLHASRMPVRMESAGESIIERYHQDSLEDGSRIRDGLSDAVKGIVLDLANGFLKHPENDALRQLAAARPAGTEKPFARDLYQHLLRLVYRLLFLMVIEERGLIHPPDTPRRLRDIYARCYALARLRRLSEHGHFADARHTDAWLALAALFRIFDESGSGKKIGIDPLGGDLFDSRSLGPIASATLDNATLLGCLRRLTLFKHPDTGQRMRVNYAALNVEEFGSVYQGLLEFEPAIDIHDDELVFRLAKGDERSKTGSHYTPEELVQPLLKHSLEHLIREIHDKHPTTEDRAKALLALKVCDVACGSGHILLAAARRIGVELAIVRTGDEQPSPTALREAIRDVIRHCIHGMDLNPLAVELCKVALWLEAHVPGQPLSFLDHRIKCGNAIVGLAHRAELQRGIPDEAFKTLAGDDKELAASLRKRNKDERKGHQSLPFAGRVEQDIHALDQAYRDFENTEELDAADYYHRREEYEKFRNDQRLRNLRLLADAQVAQFYLPKTTEYDGRHVTHDLYRKWLGGLHPTGKEIAAAQVVARRKSFAHWFLEFWDIVDAGGFDLILGNPPYLGDKALSGSYGHTFCEWVRWEYAPTGISDLVVYFLRRIYDLIRPGGFLALITTNSIKDGDVREDGLEQILAKEGELVFVTSGTRWPGVANLYVALLSLHKGKWAQKRVLDDKEVPFISALFEDYRDQGKPKHQEGNEKRMFSGCHFLGDGFLLSEDEAKQMVEKDSRLAEIIFPILNGQELNGSPLQSPGRKIINFFDWPVEKAAKYGEAFDRVKTLVKPVRDQDKRAVRREKWWQFAERSPNLQAALRLVDRCFVAAATTKHLSFTASPTGRVFTHALFVFTTPDWHDFTAVQSTIHEIWARKYSGSLETRLRYSPSECFLTFPFPASIRPGRKHADDPMLQALDAIGEQYHEYRRGLMQDLWLGLTDLYNLFHAPDLEARLAKLYAKRGKSADWLTKENVPPQLHAVVGLRNENQAREAIEELRRLHIRLDEAVLAAYGWHQNSDDGPAIALDHGFYDQDFLPENDRIRHTLHPTARRELLIRLLKLNHARAAEEQEQPATKIKSGTSKQQVVQLPTDDLDLFHPAASKARKLVLPATKRDSLAGESFLLVLVHQFLNQAGKEATVRNLDGVFHLLRNRATHRDQIITAVGSIGEKWLKHFNDDPPNTLFIPFLKKLEEQRWIEVDLKSGELRRLAAFKQPTHPHPWHELDVDIALEVLKSNPEVIELVTEGSDSTRATSAFGITQSA